MQTGSSETLIDWKSGKTTYVPLYRTEWRERGYGPRLGDVRMEGRSYSNKNNEQCGLLFYACSASLEPRFRGEIKFC